MGEAIKTILKSNPVVPVVVIQKAEDALPLADALIAGGITTMEITLRTKAALPAIALLKKERPTMAIGAGTVTSLDKLKAAADHDVDYLVSPGATPTLLKAMKKTGIPALPGTATISEIMMAQEAGFDTVKFFPAQINGGVKMLKAIFSVLPEVTLCPTGGVDAGNMAEFLALPNVLSVGGSWLTPADDIQKKKWSVITQLAREALDKAKDN